MCSDIQKDTVNPNAKYNPSNSKSQLRNLPDMGQKLSILVGVLHGANINSFSKIFDADGNGEFFKDHSI